MSGSHAVLRINLADSCAILNIFDPKVIVILPGKLYRLSSNTSSRLSLTFTDAVQGFAMIHSAQHILIVEDNRTDARLIRDLLEWYGYETLQTGDGLEAMKLAWECLPDLILMDIQLPKISGLDVTRRLKDDEQSQNIPIIAVTALAMGWHEREALDSGCDAYISKPISIFDFLHTVRSFLPRSPH
jgi:two-component system, cell cycle response regulator DivK